MGRSARRAGLNPSSARRLIAVGGHGPRLLLKAMQAVGILGKEFGKDFQGYVASQAGFRA